MSTPSKAPDSRELATALKLKKSGQGYYGTCPVCQYKQAFSLTEKQGKLLFYCHACNASFNEIMQTLASQGLVSFSAKPFAIAKPAKVANADTAPDKIAYALSLWQQSLPIEGTLAEQYLLGRNLNPPYPDVLRYHPNLKHSDTQAYYPALVGLVRDQLGTPKGIQRIYLAPDGHKAPIDPNKKSLGGLEGASVQLGHPTTQLAVAEGIETALSVQQALGVPAWAALSTAGLTSLVLPTSISKIVLAVDHDPAGIKAADGAMERWLNEGRAVTYLLPPKAGQDFNDMLREAGQL
jgi:phage/plasmid primase-like uncharacterized protein